jgi:elongation factor G
MAFKDAFQHADPQILEPIYNVEVLCPEDLTGAVMGELQSRRAVVEGMETEGHFQKIVAKVPLAEMHDFSSSLRSLTGGKAKFRMQFYNYAPMSYDQQKKLAEEYSKTATESLV